MGALSYVALLLAKYAGELATVAHEIQHDDPAKRERGRRKAHRYLKNRLYALKWCVRQLEQLLPVVGADREPDVVAVLHPEGFNGPVRLNFTATDGPPLSPDAVRAMLGQEGEPR